MISQLKHFSLHTETQFEKDRITQDRLFESDFDRFLELENIISGDVAGH